MVQLELSDAEKRDRELRIWQRNGMFSLLAPLILNLANSPVSELGDNIDKLPMSVKDIAIWYTMEISRDESIEPPSIIPAGQVDRLSRALCQFSLRPNVDSGILWPSDIDDGLLRWLNMRCFTVHMTGVLPSGKRVTIPDPNSRERLTRPRQASNSVPGEDKICNMRRRTGLQIFDELCRAAGKAAGQMLNLQHLLIRFGGGDNCRNRWADADLAEKPPLNIRTNPVLDPSEETIKVWRDTSAKLGVDFWMRLRSYGAREEESRDVVLLPLSFAYGQTTCITDMNTLSIQASRRTLE